MAEQITKKVDKVATVRDMLDKMVPQLALAIGQDVTAKRMARIAMTSVLRNPRLLDADPRTLAGAVMECAQIGLEPDGREAHLVPFNNRKAQRLEVQLIPDYKGLAKLARNSGQIKTLDWREVRKGDKFEYRYGSTAVLIHIPSEEPIHKNVPKDPKKPEGEHEWIERPITHCYSLAILEGGESVFEVMTVSDVEYHRDRYSRAASDGPWVTNFDAMGAKTCFRKLSKKLPRAAHDDRLARAVELDEKTEEGIPQNLGEGLTIDLGDAVEVDANKSKLDTLKDALKKDNGHAATAKGALSTDESAPSPGGTSESTPTPAAATTKPPAPADEAPPRSTAPAPVQANADRVESAGAGPGGAPQQPVTSPEDPRLPLLASIVGHFKTLGMEGDQGTPRLKREWISSRFLGAGVKLDGAPVEALGKLDTELSRLVELREKK